MVVHPGVSEKQSCPAEFGQGELENEPRSGSPPDLARAPLKLLAIVNRIDLAGNPSYGNVGGAEGRFVFGVLGPGCTARPFTVILEYGVPRRTCASLRDWALAWVALNGMTPGSAAYNAALEALTEQFAHAGADPGKLAGSALDQVRTDENALHPSGAEKPQWELREFTLQATPVGIRLREATVKQTPDEQFNAERDGRARPIWRPGSTRTRRRSSPGPRRSPSTCRSHRATRSSARRRSTSSRSSTGCTTATTGRRAASPTTMRATSFR
jgi:hypothetical protein